jgi:haloalkane dehalogenase
VAFSDGDPITGAMAPILQRAVPGARPARVISNAGHFLQEDAGEEVGQRIVAWLKSTSV